MRVITLLLAGSLLPQVAMASCTYNGSRLDFIACKAEEAWTALDRRVAAMQADVTMLFDELFVLSDRVQAVEAQTSGLHLAAMHCRWDGTTYDQCGGQHTQMLGFDFGQRPIVSPRYRGEVRWPIAAAEPSLVPHCVMQNSFETPPGSFHVRPDADPGAMRWSCVGSDGLPASAESCVGWQTWLCYYQPAR